MSQSEAGQEPSSGLVAPAPAATCRIGVFGIGLAAYWSQFPGLHERLEGYQKEVEKRLSSFGAEVISAGLIDDASRASQAGLLFAGKDLDLLFCYVGTYATSSQVLPIVQQAKLCVLVLNLQPTEGLDYENTDTGEFPLVPKEQIYIL